MKKNIILLFLVITNLIVFAQKKETIEEDVIQIVEVHDKEEDKSVPFASVENVPVYPGCKGSEDELRKCLQNSIIKHVNKKFNTRLASELRLSRGKKVIVVVFLINKEGEITIVKAKAPHERLKEEGIKIVKLLPKMSPGKQRGRVVNVNYTLPITLQIE